MFAWVFPQYFMEKYPNELLTNPIQKAFDLFLKSVCFFLKLSVKSLLYWVGQKFIWIFFHKILWKNPSKHFSQPRAFRITVLYQTYLL